MADEGRRQVGEPPDFNMEMAWEIYEKHVLVGLTYLDLAGNVIEQRQIHGDVIRVHPDEGIVLRLADNSEYTLPPDFRALTKAKPGEYRLRSTGEIVLDPDYIAKFTVERSYKQ